MTSKNVKTLQISWIQWATLVAAVVTLVLVAAPRFRHTAPSTRGGVQEISEREDGSKQRGRRNLHQQQPEMITP